MYVDNTQTVAFHGIIHIHFNVCYKTAHTQGNVHQLYVHIINVHTVLHRYTLGNYKDRGKHHCVCKAYKQQVVLLWGNGSVTLVHEGDACLLEGFGSPFGTAGIGTGE